MYTVKLTPKYVELDAIEWTGFNLASLLGWVLQRGGKIDYFSVAENGRVKLYNSLEDQFINLPEGHYVVCGLKGEFYPCEPEVLRLKYDVKETDD